MNSYFFRETFPYMAKNVLAGSLFFQGKNLALKFFLACMEVCEMIQLQILSDAYSAANLWNSRLHLLWFTWLPFLGIIECSHWTPIRYLSTDKCAINLKCSCNWRGKCFKVIHNIINMYIWKYLEQADPMFVGVEEAVNVVQAGRWVTCLIKILMINYDDQLEPQYLQLWLWSGETSDQPLPQPDLSSGLWS